MFYQSRDLTAYLVYLPHQMAGDRNDVTADVRDRAVSARWVEAE